MDQLDSLNYAMDSLTMQAPAVVQRTDSNPTLSTMSHIINLPTIVREQETKSPTQPVQLDVQNNETVLMNTHDCTCQPSPSQQVQEVMNIELVHFSTCVHDHSTPNCDQSLLDMHTDVKAQLQDTLATDRQKELPNLIDCGTSVVKQSSCVIFDSDIDDTVILVQSPTPCTQYSHTHHPAMHPARVVPATFQLTNGRSADHYTLTVPPQYQMELKENYIHSQTPRPGRKVKDGTLHITSTPRPTACHFLSGIT